MNTHIYEDQPVAKDSSRSEISEDRVGDRNSGELVHETRGARATEQTPTSTPQPPSGIPPASSASQPPAHTQNAASQAGTPVQDWIPQIADDTDLIEKEWVDKAKEIVARTAHDPYLQNQEVNKLKAEYLKKRYNKTLKQSD